MARNIDLLVAQGKITAAEGARRKVQQRLALAGRNAQKGGGARAPKGKGSAETVVEDLVEGKVGKAQEYHHVNVFHARNGDVRSYAHVELVSLKVVVTTSLGFKEEMGGLPLVCRGSTSQRRSLRMWMAWLAPLWCTSPMSASLSTSPSVQAIDACIARGGRLLLLRPTGPFSFFVPSSGSARPPRLSPFRWWRRLGVRSGSRRSPVGKFLCDFGVLRIPLAAFVFFPIYAHAGYYGMYQKLEQQA